MARSSTAWSGWSKRRAATGTSSGAVVRLGDLGRGGVVLGRGPVGGQRRLQAQDRRAVLRRGDPPPAERPAVLELVYPEDHRLAGVAGAQEIGVQRVGGRAGLGRALRRDQGLRGLTSPAEQAPPRLAADRAAEQAGVDVLQVQQPFQAAGSRAVSRTARRLRSSTGSARVLSSIAAAGERPDKNQRLASGDT